MYQMDDYLRGVALEGDVDKLYQIIAKNTNVLEFFDNKPFVETPLHVAASKGHSSFAVEIMRLKPSFSEKLDRRGLSPMHLALENNMISTVLRLLETENGAGLVRLKGKGGVTPLHYVVEQGNVQLMGEFLSVNPSSIIDITNQGETALHLAVKKGKTRVLDDLLEFLGRSWNRDALHREEKVLNWKDEKGYTVLHLAVEANQIEMVKSLLKANINVNAKSLSGLTVLDIVNESKPTNTDMKDLLIRAKALDSHHSIQINTNPMKQSSFKPKHTFLGNVIRLLKGQNTSISTGSRDALLVAAALVATTTFQAILSPPGGLRQANGDNDDNAGKVTMKDWVYMIFIVLNGTSFLVTTITIFLLLPHGFYGRLLTASLALLSASYLFTSTVISPSLGCALVNFGLFALFIVLLVLGILLLSNRQFFISIRKYCKCTK